MGGDSETNKSYRERQTIKDTLNGSYAIKYWINGRIQSCGFLRIFTVDFLT